MAGPKDYTRLADEFDKKSGPEIPDVEGAPTGILGIKAPAGYRQTDDIRDRLQAAGIKMPKITKG